ncbi:MAG: DNA recombination protein RmuC [Chloroflexi bacterium]|nr:DNA recombination protein RmuC [Chloroflexota bacterium]
METVVVVLAVAITALIVVIVWVLRRSPADLSGVGAADLDTKKQLIDQRLERVDAALDRVSSQLKEFEGELKTRLETMGEQTAALTSTTSQLKEVLSNSRARGQWGERMAEDILRLAGLVENVNYRKQVTIAGGGRPDFVFMLPGDLRLNMDVKFPFDNYQRFIEAESDADREVHRKAFLHDVRDRIKEITTREYIDPEGGTADYVLLFIPNESVYAFICEQDSTVLDYSLGMKVVCCSPYMLFAMLALVRQAAEHVALRQASDEVLSLLGSFTKQWGEFGGALDTLEAQFDRVRRGFENVTGRRRRALQRPLDRIEALREQRHLPIAQIVSEEQAALPPEDVTGVLETDVEDDADEDRKD